MEYPDELLEAERHYESMRESLRNNAEKTWLQRLVRLISLPFIFPFAVAISIVIAFKHNTLAGWMTFKQIMKDTEHFVNPSLEVPEDEHDPGRTPQGK